MLKLRLLLAATAIASLSACLDNDLQRGAAGAVAGAVIADATNNDVATGAVIGGVLGATCDNITRMCR